MTLQVATKKAFFYISRLSPDTTSDQVVNFLKADFPEVTCESVLSKYPERYSSYKITGDHLNKDKVMDADRWPQGTYIARYFQKRSMKEKPSIFPLVKQPIQQMKT